MNYPNCKGFFEAMKNHSCQNKQLIAADDPSNDIYQAKVEGREPFKYPTIGYICQGCEEAFYIDIKDFKHENLDPSIATLLKSASGRQKLGELFNGKS